MAKRDVAITAEAIISGIAIVDWPGRLQILRRKPWVIVDGAHNGDSIRKLVQALRQYFAFVRAIVIFGASSDKNITEMAAGLASFSERIIISQSHHPRAVKVEKLAQELTGKGITSEIAANVASAVERALSIAEPDDLVCATGSLFIVAEVMEYLSKRA